MRLNGVINDQLTMRKQEKRKKVTDLTNTTLVILNKYN